MRACILTSSILILSIILLRQCLRWRMDPRLCYALWLLAAARLLVPGTLFPAPVSIMGAIDQAEQLRPWVQNTGADSAPVSGDTGGAAGTPSAGGETPSAAPPTAPPDGVPGQLQPVSPGLPAESRQGSPHSWYVHLWCVGICAVGTALIGSNALFCRSLRRRRRLLDGKDLPGPCPLRVYLVEDLPSPCLFGLPRPAIYINRASLDPSRLGHILLHEQTHFRHRDHLWCLLRCLCLTIHWYNPLVWWAAALSRQDCELACDAGVIRRLGEAECLDYGATLVGMAAAAPAGGGLLHAATAMTAGKRTMAERLRLITARPRMLRFTLGAVVLAAALATVLTFGGRVESDSSAAPEDCFGLYAPQAVAAGAALNSYSPLVHEACIAITADYFGPAGADGAPADSATSRLPLISAPAYVPTDAARLRLAGVELTALLEQAPDLAAYAVQSGGADTGIYFFTAGSSLWLYIPGGMCLISLHPVSERPEQGEPPPGPTYTHSSGMFSLTLPDSWAEDVVYVETEDGVDFYEANTYAQAGYGWLMSVVPQPADWVEENQGAGYLTLDGFDTNGTPQCYILQYRLSDDYAHEPAAQPYAGQFQLLLDQKQALADSFQLLVTPDLISRLVHERGESDPARAIPYLPYLSWRAYRDACGEAALLSLLESLWTYVGTGQADWPQYHDILSAPPDEALEGACAETYQAVLWTMYHQAPEQFASVLDSVYISPAERANALDWLRYPMAYEEGRAQPLTDQELCQRLGLTSVAGAVTASHTDVTLAEAGDTFRLLPEGVEGIYACTYTASDSAIASVNGADGTVTALSPGTATVSMHIECSAGQFDFTCTVRCRWA